jgi:hypothetical protein
MPWNQGAGAQRLRRLHATTGLTYLGAVQGNRREGNAYEVGVSLNELARALRVPMNRISAIVDGKRHHCRHRNASGAVLWHLAPVLDEPATRYDLEVAGMEIQLRTEREVRTRSA